MWKFGEVNRYDGELDLKNLVEDLQDHIEQHDEAIYVCDLTQVEKQFEMWQKYMPRVFPYYAVKCNDDALIVKTIAELGVNFDCASKKEIEQVLASGVSPERIIFAHPCKLVSHLEYAKSVNVNTVTVDNEFEIHKIHKHAKDTNLVIRFRCDAQKAYFPLGKKFGCENLSEAYALMMLAKSLDMNVIGTSFHVGSGCNELGAYGRGIAMAKSIIEYGQELGFKMDIVDIGGGFSGSDVTNFLEVASIVSEALAEHFSDDSIKIIAEPGQYFVTKAFTLLSKIHSKREVKINGQLDTIMYYLNVGVYGSFIYVLFEHNPMIVRHFVNEDAEKFKSLIWGPTCDATDKIIENILLPNLSPGDLLAFPDMGAYTLTLSCQFNGFPIPKIMYFKCKQ